MNTQEQPAKSFSQVMAEKIDHLEQENADLREQLKLSEKDNA